MAEAPAGEKRRLTRASSRSSAPGSGSFDDMNLGMIPGASGFGTFDRNFSNHVDWEAATSFPLNSSWNSMSRGPSFGSDAGGDLPPTYASMLSPNPSIGAIDRNGSAASCFAMPTSPFACTPDFLAPSISKVPLDGFGSFSTARSRRLEGSGRKEGGGGGRGGGGGGGERVAGMSCLQPDTPTSGCDPLLLQQEDGRRGSSFPEDKLFSPPPDPSPPPPPKRRGRPPGSTKSDAAASAAAAVASNASQRGAATTKRQRNSVKEETGTLKFPEPIRAPPPPTRYSHAAASVVGGAGEKFGRDDEGDSSSSDCSSHDDDRTLSWMRTRGKSGQFLGVGDCEVFFRVRIGGEKLPTWSSDAASAGMPRIAIITSKTRDRVIQVTNCLRRGCPLPPPITAFCTRGVNDGALSACEGGKQTGHGAGKVSLALLRKMLGVEAEEVWQAGVKKEGEDKADKCAYELCPYPAHSSGNWKIVQPTTCAGKRDWSMFVGKMFCHACWTQYRTKGTLERLGRKDINCD